MFADLHKVDSTPSLLSPRLLYSSGSLTLMSRLSVESVEGVDAVREYPTLLRGDVTVGTAGHCKFLGENRLSFFVRTTKEDIIAFFKWILDVYS